MTADNFQIIFVARRTPTNYLIDDTIPSTLIKEDKNSGDLILPDGTCYLTKHSNLKQVIVPEPFTAS